MLGILSVELQEQIPRLWVCARRSAVMLQMPESGVGNRLGWFSLKREVSAIWQKRNLHMYE